MSSFTIDARQLRKLDRNLAKNGVDFKKGTQSLLKKIGVLVQGEAVDNAPTKTGDLERSITTDIGKDSVSIGVPLNAPAGSYARKMHDGKGRTWKDRGKGTQRKGAQADDKYLDRAAKTASKEIDGMIQDVVDEFARF